MSKYHPPSLTKCSMHTAHCANPIRDSFVICLENTRTFQAAQQTPSRLKQRKTSDEFSSLATCWPHQNSPGSIGEYSQELDNCSFCSKGLMGSLQTSLKLATSNTSLVYCSTREGWQCCSKWLLTREAIALEKQIARALLLPHQKKYCVTIGKVLPWKTPHASHSLLPASWFHMIPMYHCSSSCFLAFAQ